MYPGSSDKLNAKEDLEETERYTDGQGEEERSGEVCCYWDFYRFLSLKSLTLSCWCRHTQDLSLL